MDNFLSVLKRFGRTLVGIIIAGVPAFFAKDPKYILLAPVINAIGKWLRAAFGLKNVPF